MTEIEAPANTFPSQIVGPAGEQMYWAPLGSLYPVCPDGVDSKKVKEIFNKVALAWLDLVGAVDMDACEDEKELEVLKRETFPDGIPFLSLSNKPLTEKYFEKEYFVCYFASKPYPLGSGSYFTVGVIGP